MDDTNSLLRALLAYAWAPALALAGALDWALHRQQHIELTAGLQESVLHLIMMAAVGSGLLAALLLQTTAGVLLLIGLLALLHEGLYLVDLKVALASRPIPLAEQWVHGFQHLLPWAGVAGMVALAPGQAAALIGQGIEPADWSWRWAASPPSTLYLSTLLAAALMLNIVPFAEESWRCLRAWQRR